MFCKAVSEEGCGIEKSLIAKCNIFLCNPVSDQFHFITSLGN